MTIKPAPIITLPACVPITRVMHWIDEGPGDCFHDDQLWPTACVSIFRGTNDDVVDFYPGDWT